MPPVRRDGKIGKREAAISVPLRRAPIRDPIAHETAAQRRMAAAVLQNGRLMMLDVAVQGPNDLTQPCEPGAAAKVAVDAWFPTIYECLKDIASRRLHGESPGHTLQPTALVHEVYVRLAHGRAGNWRDRTHFLAVAATALREVLVDHARRKSTVKRGAQWRRISFERSELGDSQRTIDVIALDEALGRLGVIHPRAARVIEMRFFGGLELEETASLLGVSVGTVKLDWRFGRAWLLVELGES